MATFSYRAVGPGRQDVEGQLDAPTSADVVRRLQQTGHTVLAVEQATPRRSLRALLAMEVTLSRGLSDKDFRSLVREWSTLLSAGLPIHTTLALSGRGRRNNGGELPNRLLVALRDGRSLRDALAETGLFPAGFVALIGAAEASGTLGSAMARAAAEAETRALVAQKLRKELIYPAFLTVTASAAIIVLLLVVVPGIETLIEDTRGVRLPAATVTVIAVSHALRDHGLTALAGLAGLGLTAVLAARSTAGRTFLARAVLRLPVVGGAMLNASLATYTGALAALTAGGVGLARAQALAAETVTNSFVRRRLMEAETELVGGASLQAALHKTALMPEEALGLIRSGGETGRLSEMLDAASRLMRGRADRILETTSILLGPVLTIVFGLAAGMVVYAMLTTILSLNEFAFR